MSNNLFSTQNIVMGVLLGAMGWGGMQIHDLNASTALNTHRSDKLDIIIPKMDKSLTRIESGIGLVKHDIGYVKQDIDEIKKSQKDYQKDFNRRLDKL